MNKFKFYLILSIITVSIISCSKNDNSTPVEPPRDYATQYATDNTDIEEYLKTNFITVINHPGFADDQDVTISKIPAGGTQPTIFSYLNSATFPKLLTRPVSLHNITYITYYLVLRPGTGVNPCNVDGVLTSYRGDYLERIVATGETTSTVTATKFDEIKFPQTIFTLFTTQTIPLRGWSEIFPQFKTGTNTSNPDGTINYSNFGAGVMFLPSGLGYYNTASGGIPSYSPLVFSFKLYAIQRLDQEVEYRGGLSIPVPDGVLSYQEDLNSDSYMYDYRNTVNYPTAPADAIRYADDTDKDGIPDFLDVDDDGDTYTTKLEIKNPATGLSYPFASIPICTSGKRNYLDVTCHP